MDDSSWFQDEIALLGEVRAASRPHGEVPRIRGYVDLVEHRRGGQGVVYVATQASTKRRVAIKVLLEGGRTNADRRRRFEREIDIVAGLKHPNVVKVYDSGVTEDGRLFCVMEYIEGASLDELISAGGGALGGVDSVVRLFIKICDAVQFAHQRGVIHRDLKPSNVRIDATGEAHVLDFGLAKATFGPPEHTRVSMTGDFMGSLPWASPEQAAGTPDQIDTRSDVYSLGVMMYQVLTDAFPYPVVGALSDVLNHIRELEPTPPKRSRPDLDDDLSTIVLKCLAKEPDRRYQSAGEIARDLRHYLASEPIEARRDSAWYAIRKTLARYRNTVRIIAVGFVAAIAAAIWLGLLWNRATAAEKLAAERLHGVETARAAEQAAHAATLMETERAKKIAEFLDTTLRFVDPWKHPGRDITPMREMLDSAAKRLETSFPDQPDVEASLAGTLGNDYWTLGLLDEGERYLRRSYTLYKDTAGENDPRTMEAKHNLASVLTDRGKHEDAEFLFRSLLETEMAVLGPDAKQTLETLNNLGYDLDWQGRLPEAISYYERALEGNTRILGPNHIDTLHAKNNLSVAYAAVGKREDAERLMREAIAGRAETLGPDHPETLQARMNLAQQIVDRGDVVEGAEMLREVRAQIEAALGADHPLLNSCTGNLASALSTLGRYEEAQDLYQSAYDAAVRFSGAESPVALLRKNQLVCGLIELKRYKAALPMARELKAQLARTVGPEDSRTLVAAGNLASVLNELNQTAEATAQWEEIVRVAEPVFGSTSTPIVTARTNLGGVYADAGRWEEAERAYSAALDAMTKLNEAGTWRGAVVRCGLGRVEMNTGRFDESDASLRAAYEILHDAFGDDHPRTKRCIDLMIQLYEKTGDAARLAEFKSKSASPAPAATSRPER